MKEYNHQEIEKKWQDIWEKEHRFEVKNHQPGKENAYVLIEFPYPSGKGLHVGHIRSYSALDAVARKKRMQGYNVLFPMGTDSFGLEAERTAIKEHKLPQEIVARNIATFKEQLKMVGLSVDWSREISTSDPSYYKWTQWLFLQFVKHGLAEKQETTVNFCPNCGVLANEEVENGKCVQCGAETSQKPKAQWVLKMTKYAERLADDLKDTNYMEHIKTSQINWIGKSEGTEVEFKIDGGGSFKIFTTCIETIFGITFMVLAPENQLVDELKPRIKNWGAVEEYRKQASKKSEFERTEMAKTKTGCLLEGVFAINPVNGKKVPVFISDFVLASYGTGAVMAVPTHDQRDYDFAKAKNIEMIEVISGGNISEKAYEKQEYLENDSVLINSGKFSGLKVSQAKKAIADYLIKEGIAKRKVNFKMRDWIFSRQRYWGEPIPMIHCDKCGWVPVPEKDLPVTLPIVDSYDITKDGESPLSKIDSFVNTTCPVCGGKAKRETDTMPGWAGSSWYFMRYCDPHNDKEFASLDALSAWLPVGLYNGGNEHTCRHLLYARFWNKFFYDIGISPVSEPFKNRISQGIVLGSNGVKMSKSLGNVVDPREVIKEYGADSIRVWEAFMGDYFETVNWSDDGVKAANRLINRIWNMQEFLTSGETFSNELNYAINYAIDKVTSDIDNVKFNTAISTIMSLTNEIYKNGKINKAEYKALITILSPFAPHVCEELYTICGFGESMKDAVWPTADKKALIKNEIKMPVQVAGKVRGKIMVPNGAKEDEVLKLALECEDVKKYANGNKPKKVIYVPGRILNLIF